MSLVWSNEITVRIRLCAYSVPLPPARGHRVIWLVLYPGSIACRAFCFPSAGGEQKSQEDCLHFPPFSQKNSASPACHYNLVYLFCERLPLALPRYEKAMIDDAKRADMPLYLFLPYPLASPRCQIRFSTCKKLLAVNNKGKGCSGKLSERATHLCLFMHMRG